MGRPATVVIRIAILTGVVGAFIALLAWRGEQQFRSQQSRALELQSATVLLPAAVGQVVLKAPEPVPAARRTAASGVRCHGDGPGPLRNPWSCVIRYRSGRKAYYRLIVQPNGYYKGVGSGIITGCCVKVPTLD